MHLTLRHLSRWTGVLVLSTVAAPFLGAQASSQADEGRPIKANWELANRFSAASLRAVTYTQAIQPRFLGETDSMWYNWRDRNGSRFMLFIPSQNGGTKRPLFDAAKMAQQLTLLSRKPYDAMNLPFTTVTFLKSHKAFRFTVDTVRYEWTLATETLKGLGRPPRIPPADEERGAGGGGRGGGGGGGRGGNPPEFRNFSPDSTAYVFARDHNLFFVDGGTVNLALDSSKTARDTVQLSTDGVMDYSYGFRDTTENRRQLQALAGGGQQEDDGVDDTEDEDANSREMRVRASASWSPDSKAFSVVRRDQRKVKDLFLVNVLAQPRPVLLHYKYTMPGEEDVTQTELWTYRRGDKAIKQLNIGKWKDQTISDIHWPVSADKLRLLRRDRTQRNVDVIEIDVATGAQKVLLTDGIENAAIEPKSLSYLKKGGDFLWWSQKTGWGQYYVYGFDGGEKMPLTTGTWNADNISKIDSTTGTVWVVGQGRESGEQLYQTHMYRVNGNGTGFTLVDAGDANHGSTVSPTGRYIYDTYSRMDLPPKSVLRDGTTGRVLAPLEEMDLSKLHELGFKNAEPFTVKAADGVTDLFGNIWRPFDFDSTKKYPIVAYVYPGPQTEAVTTGFSVGGGQMQLAQLGMIVIQVGHRGGSPQRSLAYHRYGYFNMRDYALADKKFAIEQLAARYPYIDIERVGIYGHSGGGFLTGAAMLLPPYNEFFKVGWSESGNHDNNIYNQNWSEWNHGVRVLSKADSVRAAGSTGRRGGAGGRGNGQVEQSSTNQDSIRFDIKVPTNAELAGNLIGNLALTTGDLDNNVHPGGTIRLVNALIKANKRFDLFIYPGQPHGYRDTGPYNQRMLMEYFAEHLMGDYYRGNAKIAK